MSLLGLELSDAGIMVAAGKPAGLLEIDGNSVESPGFALAEKQGLTVGVAAERKAHLYPRQILSQFWDQLNIEPLEQPNPFAQNHAEIAFAHFARIWQNVKQRAGEMLIAVPGFYTREHLGFILGITQELGIPVKGFIPLAVAAVPERLPEGQLLHLDLHLHRFEVTRLERTEQLSQKDSISAEGYGLSKLYRRWVDAVAEEFVRNTRFDPLQQAATEQELYDRLPGILRQLYRAPEVYFEMTGGSKVYHVTLTRDLFYKKGAPVFEEMRRLVSRFYERYGKAGAGPVLMLTDRIARLPGITDMMAGIKNCNIIKLELGAGALGLLRFTSPLFGQQAGNSSPFLTSRPLPAAGHISNEETRQNPVEQTPPTHILYRHLAYPITEKPLIVGLEKVAGESGVQIQGQIAGVSRKHCVIQLQGNQVVLNDHSTYGTFVDENPVKGHTILLLGQTVRVGTPGETLNLIACLD
ncbi:MAG: FHA domain-containing protein, partial [Deltaproteobacteria bacterium]|nr:FHA domain-containing protein [Deltaproteobacteria bacterium]